MKKNIVVAAAFCLLLVAALFSFAQNNPGRKTQEFTVSGNCSMCKKNIEASLKDKPGIESAVWNKETKRMKVVYDAEKISEDLIHTKIAEAGYDTEKKKGEEKAYQALHKCCRYQRTLHK